MFWVLIVGFVSGGLVANGAPHFVKGAAGEKHRTPLGGSAVNNVVWGWANIAVAILIWHLASMHTHPRATFVAVAAGALVVGVSLADRWTKAGRT
jgi:hypothetical protein